MSLYSLLGGIYPVYWAYIQRIGHICPAWWIYIYITLGIYVLQIAYICLVKTKSMLVNQG